MILPIDGLIDLDSLRDRLNRDLSKAEQEIKTLSGRLSNKSFVQKAPNKVVLDCQLKLAEAESQANLVKNRLERLE